MSILFEPASIGRMALKNRLVKSAFLENMATPDGLPTENTLRFYERLAKGGVGLIITGMAYVNRIGKGQPFQHGADTDAMISAWRRITDSVHQLGGKIAMQIVQGAAMPNGGSASRRKCIGRSAERWGPTSRCCSR